MGSWGIFDFVYLGGVLALFEGFGMGLGVCLKCLLLFMGVCVYCIGLVA